MTAGGNDAQVKQTVDAMPIDQWAKLQMNSPAPMDQKLKRIQDRYTKEGKPVPPEYQGGGGSTGPGQLPAHG